MMATTVTYLLSTRRISVTFIISYNGNIDSRKYNGNVYFSSSKNMNANTDEITLSLRDFLVERLHGGRVEGGDEDFRFCCPKVAALKDYYSTCPGVKLTINRHLMGRLEKADGWLATINISNFSGASVGKIYGSITVMRSGSA